MGIHFACHHCNHALHVKDFQAGKRGRCPSCKGSFRIPIKDASYSSSIDDPSYEPSANMVQEGLRKARLESLSRNDAMDSDSSSSISFESESNLQVAEKPSRLESKAASVVEPSKKKTSNEVGSMEPPQAPKALSTLEPTSPLNSPTAHWFVRPPSGGQFGPAPTPLLMDWIGENRVTSDSLLWTEGMPHWQLASELLPGLRDSGKAKATAKVEGLSDALVGLEGLPEARAGASTVPIQGIALKKKIQKRRQQVNTIVFLGIVSLILLCILIYVLVFQVAKS
jgi:phage FluMu protein Com